MGVARIYLSPGLFGFDQIGTYVYFHHLERALLDRFRDVGRQAEVHRVDVAPTASIRRRALALIAKIGRTVRDGDVLHLLGHSTGGLDARLVASPSARLGSERVLSTVRTKLRSVTSLNTPHHGTPLAAFFSTVSGQRLLYLLSGLTVPVLKLGAPPIALTASVMAALPRVDHALGLRVGLVDRALDSVVQTLDDVASRELHAWLDGIRHDHGGIIQLVPEAMDLFDVAVADAPELVYQCAASYVAAPGVLDWARSVASPWTVPSATLFATIHPLTAAHHPRYPCEPAGDAWRSAVLDRLGHVPPPGANDGVVPFRSQLRGTLVWAGHADHLDVVGHFAGRGTDHHDWLASGARFDEGRFDALVDAVAGGMLAAEKG